MINAFLTYLRTEKAYSELTIKAYGDDISQFAAWYGADGDDFDPRQVTSSDVRSWIMSMNEGGMNPRSINRKVSALRSFYRYMKKSGRVEEVPFKKVSSLKTSGRLPVFVEESRMRVLFDAIAEHTDDFETERDSLIVMLFYATGIRIAELLNIADGDCSLDDGELRVTGKGDRQRVVPLLPAVVAKMRHYIALRNEATACKDGENFLFLTCKGERISRSAVYKTVTGTLEMLGVQGKRSPHVLRHTFATHMLNNGADIKSIQELLGHASLTATEVYTHNTIERIKEVYKQAHPRAKND